MMSPPTFSEAPIVCCNLLIFWNKKKMKKKWMRNKLGVCLPGLTIMPTNTRRRGVGVATPFEQVETCGILGIVSFSNALAIKNVCSCVCVCLPFILALSFRFKGSPTSTDCLPLSLGIASSPSQSAWRIVLPNCLTKSNLNCLLTSSNQNQEKEMPTSSH